MKTDWTYGTVLQHPGIKDLRVMFLSRRIGKWNEGFLGVWLTLDRYTHDNGRMKVGYVDTLYGTPDLQFSWAVCDD